MRKVILFIILLLPFSLFAKDACMFDGSYDLVGWEPGANFSKMPGYTGKVTITEVNGIYKFEGSADGMIFFGKGVTFDCKTLAFSFSSSDMTQYGVTLLTKDGNNLIAKWAYNTPDTTGAGKEIWKRK